MVFFKTVAPVEPVSFVKRICEDALSTPTRKRTRCVKRLSPMTLMDRASVEGLDKVAKAVLAPHFHQEPFQVRKVCRFNNIVSRKHCLFLHKVEQANVSSSPFARHCAITTSSRVIKSYSR